MAKKRRINKDAASFVQPSGWSEEEKRHRMENRLRAVTIQSRKRVDAKNACRGPVRFDD